MKTTFETFGTYAGVLGAFFVALGMSFFANFIWSFSNVSLACYNVRIKQYKQARMFIVFEIIAIIGTINTYKEMIK